MYTSVKYKGIVTVKEIKLSPDIPRIEMKQQFADKALELVISVLSDNKIA
jgi:hypothetical protein